MKFGKEDQIKEYLGRTKDGKVVTLTPGQTPGQTLGQTPGAKSGPGQTLGQPYGNLSIFYSNEFKVLKRAILHDFF